jgi:UDP-sugar transporter A1/2/3
VPALCYGLQNLLFFVALSNLSATSYQLWSQTKVLFTAIFFVQILGQRLRPKQWFALTLLTGGVGAVQLAQAGTETAKVAGLAARGASVTGSTGAAAEAAEAAAAAAGSSLAGSSVTVGVIAVLLSSLLSGFANIYFEKVLKEAECEYEDACELPEEGAAPNAPVSLWVRNVQLALFSIPQAALLLLFSGHARSVIAEHGLLAGFSPIVWLVTLLTAGGGLLIAAVVKYADNVLKTYATAIAIVVTCIIGTITTGVPPTPFFLCGMALVLLSMLMYNDVDRVLFRRSRVWLLKQARA